MTTHFYNAYDDSETPVTPGNDLVPQDTRPVTIRSDSGAVSINGQETTQEKAYQSLNTSSFLANDPLQARSPTGSPRMGELQPTDIVTVAGTEMTLQNAEALGLVEKGPNGKYLAVPDGASKIIAQETPQEASQDEGEALSDTSVEADFGKLVEGSTATTQFAIIGQLVNDSQVNPGTINRAASELGIAPQELNDRLGKVIDGFQAQAVNTFKAAGIEDPDGFISWAQENKSREFKAAMHTHGVERTTQGYQPLVQEYLSTIADRDPEAVLEAELGSGITATKQGNTVLLNIPGVGIVDFKTAVRERLVTVSGA